MFVLQMRSKWYFKNKTKTSRVYTEWLDDAKYFEDLKEASDAVHGEEQVLCLDKNVKE